MAGLGTVGFGGRGIVGSSASLGGVVGIGTPSGGDLLLDQYSGAAAAYSVRKLSSSYSGSALRVRRSSDNAEQDIGFSGNDLDTASLLSFVGANDGFVTKRYDQSGNGRDEVQASASNQPKIVSSGSLITKGSKAAIDITSNNAYLTAPTSVISATQDAYHVIDASAAVVGRWATVGSGGVLNRIGLIGFLGSTSTQLSVVYGVPTYYKNGTLFTGTTRDDVNTFFGAYCLQTHLGTNTSLFSGGLSVGFVTTNNDFNLEGTIQEDIYYNFDTSANQSAIESNINSYFKIYWDGSQTSLLDDYPSASAAYSVRALNSAYTGPLLRVRRSSDNAEKDIRALYDGNLDEEGLLNFVGANDGFVVTWYDQSGNGIDATQATAAKQPQIVSSGTIEKIGLKPVLKAVSGNTLLSTSLSGSTDTWSFSVNQFSSIASGGNVLALSSGVGSYLISSNGSSSSSILGATYKSVRDNTVELLTTTRDDIYEAILTRSLLTTNVNDSSFTNKQFGHPSTTAFSMPDLQEYIEYHTDQSANRADIESKINTYYDFYWDGTVSDPDAQAYLDEVVAQGGSLTNKVANEYNAFVLREKAASRYSKLKRLYPYLGGKINSAVIDAVTLNAATNANFVDGDVDATVGLTPDGSTKYLSIDNPSEIWSDAQVFQMFGFLKGTSLSGAKTNPYTMGSFNTSVFAYYGVNRNSNVNTWQGKAGSTGNLPNQTLSGSNESIVIARYDSTTAYTIANGNESTVYTVTNPSALNSIDFALFAARINTTVSNYSEQPVYTHAFTEFDTLQETKDFESSYKTFLTNIGAI